jgi:hypothetical protein
MTATETRLPALVSGGAIRPIIPQDFEGAWRIASAIAKAGMQPPGLESPEKITIAILAGMEVGLPPMQAIQSIAIINNRPSIYGDGALALVRASGLLVDMQERLDGQGEAMTATCRVRRRGENTDTIRQFSVADAKKAGLWTRKGPWEHYPQRMLAMRARAFALRDGFADVLRGLSVAEEMADVKPAPQPGPPPDDSIPDFGASVVDSDPGVSSRPPNNDASGSEGPLPSAHDLAAAALRRSNALELLLEIAEDEELDVEDRVAKIDGFGPRMAAEQLKGDMEFHKALFETAVKVARGQLKPDGARKFLEGMK